MSLNMASMEHLMNYIPLFAAINFANQQFDFNLTRTTQVGTLSFDSVFVENVSGFKNKVFEFKPDSDTIQFSLSDINTSFWLYGSFNLFDLIMISFDDTFI